MTKKKLYVAFGALLVVIFAVYSNHFQNSFHFDDAHAIQSNVYLQSLNNIPLFFKDGTTFSSLPSNQSYRPVLSTSLAIDYWLGGGLEPTTWFHIHSFALFLGVIFLAFLLYKKVYEAADKTSDFVVIAFIAAAFYALHPVCAETVNYIIQRGDIFAAFFTLLGFVLYIYFPQYRKYYLYLIVVFIGILAKPNTLVFAPLFAIYLFFFESKLNGKDVLVFAKYGKILKPIILAFAVCIAGYLFISKMQSSAYQTGGYNRFQYIITQPFVIFYYFSSWFAPIHLSADTDWGLMTSLSAEMIFGFVFIAILFVLSFITSNYEKTKPISFGLLWFLIANVPTSLIPFSEVLNDHRMFLPYVGLTLAIVWTFYLLVVVLAKNVEVTPLLKNTFLFFVGFALLGFAYGTHIRNEVWKNEETLWADCAEKSPKNARGLMNYGLVFMRRGDYKTAESYFQRGLDLWPGYSYLHTNMAIALSAEGKNDEAEKFFKSSLTSGGASPSTFYYYARFLTGRNRKSESIDQLKIVLRLSQANTEALYLLMENLYDEARYEELHSYAQQYLNIVPNDAKALSYLNAKPGQSKLELTAESANAKSSPQAYLDLSLEYYAVKEYEKSIEAAKKALELKPDWSLAYNNIGSAYNSLGKYQEAIPYLEKAIQLDPTFQLAKNNLVWANDELKKQKR